MPSRELDPSASVLAYFGAELRRYRLAAGYSQEQLGRECLASTSLVTMIETARRTPSRDFAERADETLATGGALARLWPLASREASPTWFRPFLELEREARTLRAWEPLLVPGLLQTEDYARAVLQPRPHTSSEQIEELVLARMERQEVLAAPNPPALWVLIDEGVLSRPVAGDSVMRAQLDHLIETASRPSITIQVVPLTSGAHAGLAGPFLIGSFDGSPDIAWLETALAGQVVERDEDVAAITSVYDTLRAEALPRTASRDAMTKVAEQWT